MTSEKSPRTNLPPSSAAGQGAGQPNQVQRSDPCDIGLFAHIESQTSDGDKRSLLALHAAVRARGSYGYLEIGSHLGGSLQVPIADPLCTHITSIDSRPVHQPDSRSELQYRADYPENSTGRMRSLLSSVPGAELAKLTTIDASTDAIDPATVADEPRLCFVDGEHTSPAALRDALFCARLAPRATIVFHDRLAVREAIGAFLIVSQGFGYTMPSSIFVVEPTPVLWRDERIKRLTSGRRVWDVANRTRLTGPLMAASGAIRSLR
jgi:hypothetical protein